MMLDFAPDYEQLQSAEEDAQKLGIDPEMLKYKGQNAVIITRVSTLDQNKRYGHKYQERLTRAFLRLHGVNVLDVCSDSYTGMDFQDRKELQQLRKRAASMAAEGQLHLIAMWKLDRLGRKGIQREIVRAEFKSSGLGVVSTFKDEHADDDTTLGELVRAIYAFKAEQEIFDLKARVREGKNEKLLEGKILGTGFPGYGWKWNHDHTQYELEEE